jgi:hypothetical protein
MKPVNVEIALHDIKTFIIVNEATAPLYTFENKTNYQATIVGQVLFLN